MKFKHLDEDLLKHFLNEGLRGALEREGIDKLSDDLDLEVALEQDYYELLTQFEEHLKMVIRVNRRLLKND